LELKRNKSSGKLVATQNQKNDHPEWLPIGWVWKIV
jgi:hypothetical protein